MAQIRTIEAALVDTGVLYALADRKDAWHAPCVRFLAGFDGRLIVPSSVLPEACYLLGQYLGPDAELALVRSLADREMAMEALTGPDLARTAEIMLEYRDNRVGFVDASVVAIAERLKLAAILTTDRRHFAVIRPRHRGEFRLLP